MNTSHQSRISIADLVASGEVELKTGPFGTQLKASEYQDVGIPVINVRNIGLGNLKEDKLEFISVATRDRLSTHVLRPFDIVFGRKGAVERHLLVKSDQAGWFQGSDCLRMRFNSKRVEPAFASYFFLTHEHQRWMMNQCSHGATMASLNQQILERIELPLPSLPEQRRVVEVLTAYDELIENNRRRIRILEDMARALYREWFINFRYPGHEIVPLVASALGEIPEGWEVKRATECIELNPKVSVPRDGEKPFVPMGCLANDSMIIADVETRTGNSGAKFKNGDTLFARITPCLENGKTGFVQFLPNDEAVAFGSTEFIVMRSRTLSPEYVYCAARSDEWRATAIKSMTGATGRQRVQEGCFREVRLAQPASEVLNTFSRIVRPMFQLVHGLHGSVDKLRRTRDTLLPRLLSGEIGR